MHFENAFEVEADPDEVYGFLLDVTKVVTCVPGAELTEVLDGDAYQGRMKVKVGAIATSYRGSATIANRDAAARSATLSARGRETSGAGAATMEAALSVTPVPGGSVVSIATDLNITGRVAQFGRGVIEDVSKLLIDQMANCIKQKIEHQAVASIAAGRAEPAAAPEAPPLNLLALLFSIVRKRIVRLFRRGRGANPGAQPER